MIVRKHLDPKVVIQRTWRRVTMLLLVSAAVALLNWWQGKHIVSFSVVPASILGVAISFLVGFRVNSAYERWWEARKLWGAIVNDSRSFARQATTFLSLRHNPNGSEAEAQALARELVYRQIAFAYATKNSLRKLEVLPELAPFLPPEEIQSLSNEKNIPVALLHRQAQRLRHIHESGYIEDFRHMQMDAKLSTLNDSLGGCERIKNTVFPRQYSDYSTLFVIIYTFLLPFTLVKEMGFLVIPATVVIGFIFYALDAIASGIDNPFNNTLNDTPLNSICRTIEINLRQMLGEEDLPPPVEPVNGFLM